MQRLEVRGVVQHL